ncbi:Pycsar system effector family protein [Kitasatospora sp. NPDC058965]|uniref:Pycsar system effector family protein n=1 Tax=Kitasatospora sp. NPDC058965 TaxID=3346682 RepID=UPI0036C01CFA
MTAAPDPAAAPVPSAPAAVPAPAAPADPAVLAERLLATVREDIGRADTKAAILLSAALALPALLLGRPAGPHPHPLAAALLAVGGLLWAAGTGALVRAILPRTRTLRRGRGELTYFGDLLENVEAPALARRLAGAAADPLGWALVQAVDVSAILAAKYRWIRWSVALLAPGALLTAAGLLLV